MDESAISRLETLLQDTLEVAEENNKILRDLRRTARWAFWGKLVLWTAVIALPFIFLGPILHALLPISGTESSQNLFGVPSPDQIKGLIQAYQQASSSGQ